MNDKKIEDLTPEEISALTEEEANMPPEEVPEDLADEAIPADDPGPDEEFTYGVPDEGDIDDDDEEDI